MGGGRLSEPQRPPRDAASPSTRRRGKNAQEGWSFAPTRSSTRSLKTGDRDSRLTNRSARDSSFSPTSPPTRCSSPRVDQSTGARVKDPFWRRLRYPNEVPSRFVRGIYVTPVSIWLATNLGDVGVECGEPLLRHHRSKLGWHSRQHRVTTVCVKLLVDKSEGEERFIGPKGHDRVPGKP